MTWIDVLADIVKGATLGSNERLFRQQTSDFDELFLLLCFIEAASRRTPAACAFFGTLLDRHEGTQVGIERPPGVDDLRCC